MIEYQENEEGEAAGPAISNITVIGVGGRRHQRP